jgi:hypothetical protein
MPVAAIALLWLTNLTDPGIIPPCHEKGTPQVVRHVQGVTAVQLQVGTSLSEGHGPFNAARRGNKATGACSLCMGAYSHSLCDALSDPVVELLEDGNDDGVPMRQIYSRDPETHVWRRKVGRAAGISSPWLTAGHQVALYQRMQKPPHTGRRQRPVPHWRHCTALKCFQPPPCRDVDTDSAQLHQRAAALSHDGGHRLCSQVMVDGYPALEKYCGTCHLWRPPRSHHCRVCNHCMARFDHVSSPALTCTCAVKPVCWPLGGSTMPGHVQVLILGACHAQ